MPCSDSSSSIFLKLDHNENFLSFDYAKITCGREITADTGLVKYFKGKSLEEISQISFAKIVDALKLVDEESQFILYMEWDALRSSIAQYQGLHDERIDTDRCKIISIEHTEEGIDIAQIILPPKELPKILPCNLGQTNQTL